MLPGPRTLHPQIRKHYQYREIDKGDMSMDVMMLRGGYEA
jgi:hypothetical protein